MKKKRVTEGVKRVTGCNTVLVWMIEKETETQETEEKPHVLIHGAVEARSPQITRLRANMPAGPSWTGKQ